MKFDLKLFVLVGVLAGLCDVWGAEDVKNDYDGFIVGKWTEDQENELKAAMAARRVIKAVYTTKLGGDVRIINGNFPKKLSKVFAYAVNSEDEVKEVDISLAKETGMLYYYMNINVEYAVYLIFNNESFDSKSKDLLVSTAWMFEAVHDLICADFRCFNTKSVTNMSYMFFNCTSLTELDLSKFDTKNVTNMSNMFYLCSSLTKLDLSKFDTTKVTDMADMFTGWTSCQQVFLPSTCAERKKRCICCGDEYVRWNNHEVGGLNPEIVQFNEEPKEIIKETSTGK